MLGAFNAVPGQAVAGNSPPGNPGPSGGAGDSLGGLLGGALTVATPVTATFLGTTTRTYTQYLDVDPDAAGVTLVAQPLGTYEITIADQWQNLGGIPGDGLWGMQASPGIGTGFNAIPGRAVAGDSSPGYSGAGGTPEDSAVLGGALDDALAIAVPVTATFLGTSSRTYTQYLDTDPEAAGTTLVAEPLNTYQLVIADQWQGLSGIPADGLWDPLPVPRGILSFSMTPGFAVIGGMSIGFPGFTGAPDLMEDVLEEPARETRALVPSVRVVRGRPRRLRPAPARRRSSRHAAQRSPAER